MEANYWDSIAYKIHIFYLSKEFDKMTPNHPIKENNNNRLSAVTLLNDYSEVECGTQPDTDLLSFNAHDNPMTSVLF